MNCTLLCSCLASADVIVNTEHSTSQPQLSKQDDRPSDSIRLTTTTANISSNIACTNTHAPIWVVAHVPVPARNDQSDCRYHWDAGLPLTLCMLLPPGRLYTCSTITQDRQQDNRAHTLTSDQWCHAQCIRQTNQSSSNTQCPVYKTPTEMMYRLQSS